jgi:hypothetical protein
MGTEVRLAHTANMHSALKHGHEVLIMSKALCCNTSAAYLIAVVSAPAIFLFR